MKIPNSPAAVSFNKRGINTRATVLREWEGDAKRNKSEDLQNQVKKLFARGKRIVYES